MQRAGRRRERRVVAVFTRASAARRAVRRIGMLGVGRRWIRLDHAYDVTSLGRAPDVPSGATYLSVPVDRVPDPRVVVRLLRDAGAVTVRLVDLPRVPVPPEDRTPAESPTGGGPDRR